MTIKILYHNSLMPHLYGLKNSIVKMPKNVALIINNTIQQLCIFLMLNGQSLLLL